MDPKAFGARLKELREAAGLSQKALADKAGLSQRAVASWELGEREPLWSKVVLLAKALGVDCRAFEQEPELIREPKPGRPRKTPPADQVEPEKPPAKKGKKRPKRGMTERRQSPRGANGRFVRRENDRRGLHGVDSERYCAKVRTLGR